MKNRIVIISTIVGLVFAIVGFIGTQFCGVNPIHSGEGTCGVVIAFFSIPSLILSVLLYLSLDTILAVFDFGLDDTLFRSELFLPILNFLSSLLTLSVFVLLGICIRWLIQRKNQAFNNNLSKKL